MPEIFAISPLRSHIQSWLTNPCPSICPTHWRRSRASRQARCSGRVSKWLRDRARVAARVAQKDGCHCEAWVRAVAQVVRKDWCYRKAWVRVVAQVARKDWCYRKAWELPPATGSTLERRIRHWLRSPWDSLQSCHEGWATAVPWWLHRAAEERE